MALDTPANGPLPAANNNNIVTPPQVEPDEKRIAEVTRSSTTESNEIKAFPLSWKVTALVCGVALSWGSSFSENTLGPLKSTLKKQLDINNSQVSIAILYHTTKRGQS